MGDVRDLNVRRRVGQQGEKLAAEELQRQGMTIVARNWTCSIGEIDIIAEETDDRGRTVVFCEVKCRTGVGYGEPLEAITYAKVRKLRQLAAEWLRQTDVAPEVARIDAIGVVLEPRRPPRLTHVRDIG